jgi:hypothetical protein
MFKVNAPCPARRRGGRRADFGTDFFSGERALMTNRFHILSQQKVSANERAMLEGGTEEEPLPSQVETATDLRKDGRKKGEQHKPKEGSIRETAKALNRPRAEVERDLQIAKLDESAMETARNLTFFGVRAGDRYLTLC